MSVIESAKRILRDPDKTCGEMSCDECNEIHEAAQEIARFTLSLSERLTPDVIEAAKHWSKWIADDPTQPSDELVIRGSSEFKHAVDLIAVALPIIAQLREGT